MNNSSKWPKIDCPRCRTTLSIEDEYSTWDFEYLEEGSDYQLPPGLGKDTILCMDCVNAFQILIEHFPEADISFMRKVVGSKSHPNENWWGLKDEI